MAARIFARLLAARWVILALYALILPPAAYFAARVGQDNSIDRLIVATDPDVIRMRAFQQVFGAGEYALLVAEAEDPFSPAVLARFDQIERALGGIPRVQVDSALSVFRRGRAGFEATPEQVAGFRAFATGTAIFRKQGLVGDGFLTLALVLSVEGREDRAAQLARIDRALAEADPAPSPIRTIRRIGQPYVNVHLDEESQRSGAICFGLFGVFVVTLIVLLYRSARTLVAFLVTLGACLALSVGYIGWTGGTFTIVSPMVPMTILVTTTATLVYIHGRFVDRPEGTPVDEHHVFALANKFVACTASMFATAVGFAALAVSDIRPIREMGIWVAIGLGLSWVVVFTLFPALQRVLRTPTQGERRAAAAWFERFAEAVPRFSYRLRWPLVLGSLGLSALGAVALFGAPGVLSPMPLLTNPVEYIDPRSTLYQDTKRLEQVLPGVAVTEIWLKGTLGTISEPEVLDGLDRFHRSIEAEPDVGAVVGPTTMLRIMRYLAGEGDGWPEDAGAVEGIAADLEALAPTEPAIGRFVQRPSLGQTHLAVISRAGEDEAFRRLEQRLRALWDQAVARAPALKQLELQIVGLAPLQAKMSQSLVPTLVESFALTVAIIFCTFLVIFRSGAARLMAMIPSIFAILMMFGIMRATGMMLNVATILIASTVLGTSENDQIHFFYHYTEKRGTGSVEASLRHTLRVSGRAIFFATLINAGGFFAFAMAGLPPMRQFGVLSATAFVLSMVADFTALPAALWLLSRERPDEKGRA